MGPRTTPEFQILSLAKQFLAGQLGVIAASRKLIPLRHEVEPELAEALLVFTGIDSESSALPIGDVQHHWSPKTLAHKDLEITEVENFHRQAATEAATCLLQLLETTSRTAEKFTGNRTRCEKWFVGAEYDCGTAAIFIFGAMERINF